MWQVTIDKEKCTGDEECVDICPMDVLEMVDGKAEVVKRKSVRDVKAVWRSVKSTRSS